MAFHSGRFCRRRPGRAGEPALAGSVIKKTAEAPADASYSISIAGSVTGTGSASLSGGKLTLSASVTDESGKKGTLSVTDLPISKGRYAGAGTVLGQSLTITGRLDDIPPGDSQVKTQRLVGTFTIADGTHGRIAGFVPRRAIPASSPHRRHRPPLRPRCHLLPFHRPRFHPRQRHLPFRHPLNRLMAAMMAPPPSTQPRAMMPDDIDDYLTPPGDFACASNRARVAHNPADGVLM